MQKSVCGNHYKKVNFIVRSETDHPGGGCCDDAASMQECESHHHQHICGLCLGDAMATMEGKGGLKSVYIHHR